MKRKILLVIVIVLLIVFFISFFGKKANEVEQLNSEGSNQVEQLTLGGSNPGGSAYVVGNAYTQIINKYVPNINITHEVTAGGKENIELTSNGEVDFGCGMSAFLYEAYNGFGDYENDARSNLRAVIPWFEYPMQIIVRSDSNIKSISDLKGKRISINVKGSGGYKAATEVFSTLGLKENEDYTAYYLSFDESADEMKLGNIDAIFINTSAPVPAIISMGSNLDFDIISFTDEEIQKITEKYPYYTKGVLKANTYEKINYDVNTLTSYTILFANSEVSDDIVYNVVKAIWEHRDELILAHSSQKDLNEELVKNSIFNVSPIHDGAKRFYKEIGIIEEE